VTNAIVSNAILIFMQAESKLIYLIMWFCFLS